MDPGGVNTIYYDAAAVSGVGATRFQGNVEIDGTAFYLPNAVSTFGAAATFAAAVSVNTILTVAASRGLKFSSQTSGAAAQTATLTNAPAAGNPAFWIPVTVNGVNYQIPAWTG